MESEYYKSQLDRLADFRSGKLEYDDDDYRSGPSSFPRHAILHRLRGILEMEHRFWLNHLRVSYEYQPPTDRILDPSWDMLFARQGSWDFYNKTAPFYIFSPADDLEVPEVPEVHFGLVCDVLQNWLYRKWFRPYRSELEGDPFIAKFIGPDGMLPRCTSAGSLVDLILGLHAHVCDQAEASRRAASTDRLQPSFRAVAIIVIQQDYADCDSADLGPKPVYIVRTGVETGLSAPITFDSIAGDAVTDYVVGVKDGKTWTAVRTSLDTAFAFLTDLQQREEAAFGVHPIRERTPEGMFHYPHLEKYAHSMGWEGDLKLETTSSGWVDMDLYPEWCGDGACFDLAMRNNADSKKRQWATRRTRLLFQLLPFDDKCQSCKRYCHVPSECLHAIEGRVKLPNSLQYPWLTGPQSRDRQCMYYAS
ncbi:hypothetical protein QBC46DRAFT_437321 [Diplogelasinospora grovesii]|uniref:Uncharacterized protein n=1 Tax=Diplogelasinospora grovesii TaxID=303347 RepID=A0AAN6N5G1_9PEZI|nr:hypothetical protein QBC46DRAFT_437321 [Diplogelasinospora grovesii]